MVEVPDAREISVATVEEMVELADPAIDCDRVVPADRGFCSVYRVEPAGDVTTRYLKASPDGQPWGIPVEARIQAVLDAQTSIPVPEVLGVVDDHDEFPTPFYVMTGLPGEELPYERVGRLSDDALCRLARDIGAFLGELHSIPAVDRFGHVRHDGPSRSGGRPTGTPSILTVGDPSEAWESQLRAYIDRELDRHADSRFADCTPDLREWFETAVDELSGPFEPVMGRNDHGLHNLLVEPDTGAVTGMIDWGYTLAVPASFDFEFAVYLFSGAFLAGLSDVDDRRPLVRSAMVSGYRTTAPDRVERVLTPEPCYEALAMVRIMNDFHHLDLPAGTESAVADRIRADLRACLDRRQ